MKLLRILLIVVGCVIGVVALCLVGMIIFSQYSHKSVTGNDGVAAGYTQTAPTGGPLEQRYRQTGSYPIDHYTHDQPGAGTYHIYYPKLDRPQPLPLVVMVNGTKTPATDYLPILEHLASWGFVVAGNQDPQSGSGASTAAMLDALLALNTDPSSPLHGKVKADKIGIAGHSQGGAGAINAATKFANSGRYSALYTASAANPGIAKTNGWEYDSSQLKLPYFMMAGTGMLDTLFISPLSDLKAQFEAPQAGKFGVMARSKGANHQDVLEYGDAYMTAWFLWQLHGDSTAAGVFTGAKPELPHNHNWQDVQQHGN